MQKKLRSNSADTKQVRHLTLEAAAQATGGWGIFNPMAFHTTASITSVVPMGGASSQG